MSKLDILLPTSGERDLEPVLKNIGETTDNPHKVTVITEGDSPAKAVNIGFRKTKAPYFIFWNDDFKAHPHWDTKALEKMTDGISVVAINDGDPRQTTQWGTITLVRRSYVDDYGGTENKGEVLHEGYKHNFVDTEFWQRAAARRVVEIAKDSLVEHLHPAFGKGDPDSGYQKSGDTMAQDAELFARRKTWLA